MNRSLLPIVLLSLTIAVAFVLPKPKYKSADILSRISIPESLPGWQSKDISGKIDLRGTNMNFISHVFAREYTPVSGNSLYLFILDADNFHHPKWCIAGAGFSARELEDIEFKVPNRAWKAKAIYFKKENEGFLTVYWMCINKKQVTWTGQKFIQLWYSLLNKQKTGLMVRIDIPTASNHILEAKESIQELLTRLAAQIPPEQNEYLFGK